MKITKQSFSFNIKKSVNYNSVNVGQSIEVEYDAEDVNGANIFRNFKDALKKEVKEQLNTEVLALEDDLKPKPEPKQQLKKDLLS